MLEPVLILARFVLLSGVILVTPLAEPEGRAGEPANFRELAPPTCVIWKLTGKRKRNPSVNWSDQF